MKKKFLINKFFMKECLVCDTYKKKYFGGLLSIKYNLNSNNIIYKFLGLNFMNRSFYNVGKSLYKIFKFIHIVKSPQDTAKFLLPVLVLRLKQQTNMENIDAIPLQCHLGETLMFLYYMKEWIINNNIKNPVFVSAQDYLKSLCEIFYPEIPFILVPPIFFNLHPADIPNYEYKGVRYHQNLSRPCFVKFEKKLKTDNSVHFYGEHMKTLGVLNADINLGKFPKSVVDSAEIKMKMLNLKKPFVFISPNAKSNGTMSKDFWDKLPVQLYKLGYDMFFNEMPWNIPNSSYKHCYLSIAEARYIAQQADVIFSVRSGLTDVIANPNSIIFCVYHAFFKRGDLDAFSAQKALQAFSLKYLPIVDSDKIFEYNGEKESEGFILQDIIKRLSRVKGGYLE